jgi:glycosyltransferase involved in cell wall biosynthesis
MTALTIVLVVLLGLVALVWCSRHLLITIQKHHGFLLTGDYAGPPADAPFISVLVAAKDEEEVIEQCVRTILDQDYPNYEVIVCNDRSNDRTAEIVQAIADEDDRLTLVNITNLPEGWFGKNNAMQTGIKQARGEYIVMIDADCRQVSRRTLSTAVQYALDNDTDMLSVFPELEMKGFWENVLQPVASAIMVIWFQPDRINNPKRQAAYANGAFMMIKRDIYEAIGTHEVVKTELNEDMRMAWLVKQRGFKLRVVRSQDLYLVRMYTSFKQMIRGWSRIFFGTFGTPRRLFTTLTLMLVMNLMPWAIGATAWTLALTGAATGWFTVAGAATAVMALQLAAIFRYFRLIRGCPWLFWIYPVACLIMTWCLLISISKLRPGATVVWKSTPYAKDGEANENTPTQQN